MGELLGSGLIFELSDETEREAQGRTWTTAGGDGAILNDRIVDIFQALELIAEPRVAGGSAVFQNARR